MNNEIVNLAQKFVAIKSTSENPLQLREILDLAVSNLTGFTVERFLHNGVESVLVYKGEKRPEKFKIILNGHLDIIPGKDYQYTPRVENGRLYGAGAMDMKMSVACLIKIFNKIANKLPYPIALQLVTDEEVGGFNGTKYQIENGVRSEFVIAAEPTNFDIVNEAKGILQLQITARGETAHGAYPWRGKNAILMMNEFLNVLSKKYPSLKHEVWETTVNVAKIETSNSAMNKIPDDCTVYLDVRFISKDGQSIKEDIERLLSPSFTHKILAFEPAMVTDKNNSYLKLLSESARAVHKDAGVFRSANGSSDARHFAQVGSGSVEFGPIGEGIGSDSEWVDIESAQKYCLMLENFLMSVKP